MPEKAERLGMESRPGDTNDRDALGKSLQSVDAILPVSGTDGPTRLIALHRNVIEAVQSACAHKVVDARIQGPEEGRRSLASSRAIDRPCKTRPGRIGAADRAPHGAVEGSITRISAHGPTRRT